MNDQPVGKQFLLMVDECGMAALSQLMPSTLFLQIQGMPISGNDNHQVIVTPVYKPPVSETIEEGNLPHVKEMMPERPDVFGDQI